MQVEIHRQAQLQDAATMGTVNTAAAGIVVGTTLGASGAIGLATSSFGSIYVIGSPSAQLMTFYGCNSPNDANSTFQLLYDQYGNAVTLTMGAGIYQIPDAAMCCAAIKIVAPTTQVNVVVHTKG